MPQVYFSKPAIQCVLSQAALLHHCATGVPSSQPTQPAASPAGQVDAQAQQQQPAAGAAPQTQPPTSTAATPPPGPTVAATQPPTPAQQTPAPMSASGTAGTALLPGMTGPATFCFVPSCLPSPVCSCRIPGNELACRPLRLRTPTGVVRYLWLRLQPTVSTNACSWHCYAADQFSSIFSPAIGLRV